MARVSGFSKARWEVGICGTFDVANYGDLLFPLIAEAELAERLGEVTLHRFSYEARTPPAWPYEVTSLTALPELMQRLDGLLIGGGFLIRFDKEIAPGYAPPAAEIHHPTGYWLTPALMALQHDVPLVWNAPGMHCNEIPEWADPLMQIALTLSRYVSVRDEPSRSALARMTSTPIAVVPDTAFRIPRLLNLAGAPSAEFTRICVARGLSGPYIVVQATLGLERFVRFIKNHAERFRKFRFLALPMGPALGEREEIIDADLPGVVRLAEWPSPLVLAELIGRSEAVVGHSYHLFITALAWGVPVFTRQSMSTGKYSALERFEGIHELPPDGEPELEWFLARVGRTAPSAAVCATHAALAEHWDRIAAALQAEGAPTAPTLNRFWQCLPTLLEDAATREEQAAAAFANERADGQQRLGEALGETMETRKRLDEALGQLAAARRHGAEQQDRLGNIARQLTTACAETAARDGHIAEIRASLSWRLTAPLRFAGRRLLNLGDGN